MKGITGVCLLLALFAASARGESRPFQFERDTFGFANMTVFEYKDGVAHVRRGESGKQERYTRRCFVLSRTALQFRKFARFDPKAAPLNDGDLAARIRQITRRAVWKSALPENERVVIPGYSDVRDLSRKRGRVVQDNVGLGWPTYWRPGNYRSILRFGRGYQQTTHENLDAALARGDLFVGYLTTLPGSLSINHAVLVFRRTPSASPGTERYLVYDSNHPEGPRELTWREREQSFAFQKDWDFIGGRVRVYQVYGKPLQ